MITLTENAVAIMKAALSRAAKPTEGFRITIQAGGCAGFKYLMGLEELPREDDTIIEAHGVKIFVDVASQTQIDGMIIDFVTGIDSAGFVFDNPNAREKCACGKSVG
ncbi:iron-sulfur cluster assembly accessory protein [Allorhizobium undicola]|uniref:iron-sulfur cluster assembly accessory protein n=1 Tax=Allorhizobium undicola TaxID=78527 RepID=UPI000484DAF1|nr:iron-sulfur cluster assembly accessory protein [Allorhizobium undicola]